MGFSDTTEDAARAYDVASIKLQGINAVTNFDISDYDVESIRKNLNLPKGKRSSRLWTKKTLDDVLLHREKNEGASSSTLQNQLVDEAVDPYIPTSNFFHTNPNPSFLDDWRSTGSTGAQAGNSGGTEFGGVGFRNYGVPVENPNNSWMKSFGVGSSINAIWSTEFQTIQPYEQFDQNAPQNQLLNVEQLQDQNENTNQILNQSSNFSLLGGDYQNPSCQSHNSNSLNGLPAGVEADDLEEGLGKSFDMSDIASILAADF
ncbi:AP2-like ethylene-responsive transcription factor [Quillaja saponaria]|uniref:AP2-like ethylene-responsive transcription factor n=1 Tax=Quillaja saponaria TaxID=32244 RepID=A0AAD7PZV3_QUISA|nr:AP2-like ethylene-responsive transcription factor [Quillaja saponaria]